MKHEDDPSVEKYEALVKILKSLPRQALTSSSKVIMFTAALGVMAIAVVNRDPNTFAPAINMFFAGLGIESLGIVLDRMTSGSRLSREDIRVEIEGILNKSTIQSALSNPQFVRGFSEYFTVSVLKVIQTIVDSEDGDLARGILQEFLGHNLIHAELEISTEKIVTLLSKSDQKRDTQFDEVTRQIDRLLEFLQHQSILSIFPRTRRPLTALPLVGRDDDLKWLVEKAEHLEDCLLVGQPGSGKTFLFRKLVQEYRAFFVLGDDRRQLQLAIREHEPKILLVDDAHAYSSILSELRQIREESALDFAIFTNSWPSKKVRVAYEMGLSELDMRELSLLSRDQIVEVLASMEITEPWGAVYELVNQAEGRPGLVVTLANLYLKGSYQELFSGDAVANHLIEEYLEDERDARYVLAALSLGGDYGMLPTIVASSLGLSPIVVDHLLGNLAAAGIILEVGSDSFLSVRPRALRDVLIRDVFFTRSLLQDSLRVLLQQVPSLTQTTLTLISAKRRGVNVPDQLLRQSLEVIQDEGWHYDPNRREVWVAYAALGPQEATWAIERGQEYLSAIAPYALRYVPETVLPILLDNAVGDDRPLNSNPDHPMRLIKSWVTALNNNTVIEDRRKLFDAAKNWYVQKNEPQVCLNAILLAVEPALEGGETDPGEGNTFTIRPGYFTLYGISQLMSIWADVVEFLRGLPINGWKPLLDVVRGWVYYRTSTGNQGIPDDVAQSAKYFALQMVEDVATLAPEHQGLARALENVTRHETVNLDLSVSEEFRTLYPFEDRENRKESEQQQKEAAKQLAAEWGNLAPHDIALKLEHIEREARQANLIHPRYTKLVCYEIAQNVIDPLSWLDEMLVAELPSGLLEPFATKLSNYDRDTWIEYIHRFLQNRSTTWLGITFILNQSDPNDDDLDLIWPILPEYTYLVDNICSHGTPSRNTLLRLLNFGTPEVEFVSAEGLWHRFEGRIKDELSLYMPWRRIVIENFDNDFELSQIFPHDPEIAYRWLAHRISREYPQYYQFDRALSSAIENIDDKQRRSLIERISEPHVHIELIEALIDADVQIYSHLLKQEHLKEVHLLTLPRVTDNSWVEKATAALEAGYTPQEIAQAGTRSYSGELLTQGERANRWSALIDKYSEFETHDNHSIREIAVRGNEYSQQKLDQIRLEERHRAIYGRD